MVHFYISFGLCYYSKKRKFFKDNTIKNKFLSWLGTLLPLAYLRKVKIVDSMQRICCKSVVKRKRCLPLD